MVKFILFLLLAILVVLGIKAICVGTALSILIGLLTIVIVANEVING